MTTNNNNESSSSSSDSESSISNNGTSNYVCVRVLFVQSSHGYRPENLCKNFDWASVKNCWCLFVCASVQAPLCLMESMSLYDVEWWWWCNRFASLVYCVQTKILVALDQHHHRDYRCSIGTFCSLKCKYDAFVFNRAQGDFQANTKSSFCCCCFSKKCKYLFAFTVSDRLIFINSRPKTTQFGPLRVQKQVQFRFLLVNWMSCFATNLDVSNLFTVNLWRRHYLN